MAVVVHPALGARRPQGEAEAADARRQRLTRMQWIATGLMVLMAAVFIAASLVKAQWPAAAYVRAFAEAALIGACADWFAVTALFRRPLGLPIPHTAIIPRNKDRIGEALGRFIVDNFLSPRVLDAKLRQLELAAWGGAWLSRPTNARAVAARIVAWTPELVRTLPEGALEELAAAAALAAVRAIPAAATAGKLVSALWAGGRAEAIIAALTERLGAWLEGHQQVIADQVQAQSWPWLPKWVDKIIAEKITAGLRRLLSDLRQADHPWRVTLAAQIEVLIERMATDPAFRARGEAIKQALLDDPQLSGHVRALWSDIKARLAGAWTDGAEELEAKLARLLVDLAAWLRDDPALQRTLNTGARALARKVIGPRRHDIGGFVTQVVASWDTKSVVDRLELQIGADLQYIRVSGTLVGGVVGLALYSLSRWLRLA